MSFFGGYYGSMIDEYHLSHTFTRFYSSVSSFAWNDIWSNRSADENII